MSPSSAGPTARESVRIKFKETVLETALNVFSECGYRDAQMREIADRAGVATGTLYNLFENKEGLYRAIILEHGMEIASAFSELFQRKGRALEILYEYVELKGELYERNEKALKLFFADPGPVRMSVGHGLPPDMRKIYDSLVLQLAGVISRGLTAGELKSDMDPYELAVALDSVANGFIILAIDHPDKFPYRGKAASIFKMFFGALASQRDLNRAISAHKSGNGK